MNCKTLQDQMPDLLLDPAPNPALVAHLAACPPCKQEYTELQSTLALLDLWTAPEPSPYFDQKLAVRIREEQLAPPMTWFERLQARLAFNTGRQLRPILTGALATLLLIGGGTFAGVHTYIHPNPVEASDAVVKDLQILDRNEQAFQQLDQLLQDDEAGSSKDTDPPSPPIG